MIAWAVPSTGPPSPRVAAASPLNAREPEPEPRLALRLLQHPGPPQSPHVTSGQPISAAPALTEWAGRTRRAWLCREWAWFLAGHAHVLSVREGGSGRRRADGMGPEAIDPAGPDLGAPRCWVNGHPLLGGVEYVSMEVTTHAVDFL